jgi:hypothetical protein
MDVVDDEGQVPPFLFLLFQSLRTLSVRVNNSKTFVASESFHMIIATNVCANRTATRLKKKAWKSKRDVKGSIDGTYLHILPQGYCQCCC